jgi:ribosomal protein S18 acetylase RimI-like enzyme
LAPLGVEIAPFGEEHAEGAAELLAARHARHREVEPLLPELENARAEIERARAPESTSGVVALDGDAIAGFLVGALREDEYFGQHVWVGHGAHAAREPEIARDLYAGIAGEWVAQGAALHLALVPAVPEVADPWFRLAFAHMQVHAIRESGADPRPPANGLTVRQAGVEDLRAATPLLTLIWEHHTGSPTFTGLVVPDVQAFLADWEETLVEYDAAYFVAELEGRIVGHLALYPEEPNLATPPGSVYLAVAATLPETRGLGAGVALTDAALAWARDAGYHAVHTDWRMANLQSSRFWPRRGFRETFYRLARRVEIG